MMTVHEAADVTRPSQLRHVWHSLWSRTPRASFRQTPEFLEASLAAISPDQNPFGQLDPQLNAEWQGPNDSGIYSAKSSVDRWRFLIVSAWQRPIGIMPLRERLVRRAFGTFRVLSVPQSLWGSLPGPVGPHPATTLAAAVRHLVDKDESWDILELPEVVADGVEPNRVPQFFESSGRAVFQRPCHELLGLELPATFGQFWANRDSAARQFWRELNSQQSLRSVEKFVRFRPDGANRGDTLRDWEFLNQLERIVGLQAGTPHGSLSQKMFECLRETHPLAVDAGAADVSVLFRDSRLSAFAYNFHCRARVETALLLADPRAPHARERLIGLMLRDEIARGDTWHVFLPNSVPGTAVDRRLWGPIELQETTVTHDRHASIRSRFLHWLDGDRPVTPCLFRSPRPARPTAVDARSGHKRPRPASTA
ncbi:MAG: hypothetical protein IAG10_08730 [Planctomycetaceae bacterium]|nr:hypothetical protein [Planctomycetaceae bacterium]